MFLEMIARELKEEGFATAKYDHFYKCVDIKVPSYDSLITIKQSEITMTTFEKVDHRMYPKGSIKVDINDPESIEKLIKCLKNLNY